MLHRSTSSRRRRSSRSAASSPQVRGPRSGSMPPAGRRASIAVSSSCGAPLITTSSPERSPRDSLALDNSCGPRFNIVPSSDSPRNSRNNLALDIDSLLPDSQRSPRNSLVPDSYNRSPRNSIVSESALSPRNSLVPDTFNRSPRNSIAVDMSFNRSPRNSIVPDTNRSPRHSLIPGDLYSSRHSLNPEFNKSPRHSIAPLELECGNIAPRSPRHSITPDFNKSPRGSIAPESASCRVSPRGSIAEMENRSSRGSIAPDQSIMRSPRGSLGGVSRNDIDPGRSPRGSLTLTFQEPLEKGRRASADTGTRGRSTSPYRMSTRCPQVNLGYNGSTWSEAGSRRASSSVSQQVSGDDQRRLCSESTKLGAGGGGTSGGGGCGGGDAEMALGISLTTYGSVTYQLKDANMESSGTCDFVCRALRIVNKTVVVTVGLACLSTMPLIMLMMGIQFLRDCPREPHIPLYMIVGGAVGCIKMFWLLWQQLKSRRRDITSAQGGSVGARVAALGLTAFLLIWFTLGNYWILRIKWPYYTPTLFEPNRWCHRTLYIFALVHLCIVYVVIGAMTILVVTLAICQVIGCPWLGPTRFK